LVVGEVCWCWWRTRLLGLEGWSRQRQIGRGGGLMRAGRRGGRGSAALRAMVAGGTNIGCCGGRIGLPCEGGAFLLPRLRPAAVL
jgi:hypothetical protein